MNIRFFVIRNPGVLLPQVVLFLLTAVSGMAHAQTDEAASLSTPAFAIHSRMYVADQSEPVSSNLTLFVDDVVYDFCTDPRDGSRNGEIVIYDRRARQTVLLDTDRDIKLEMHELQIRKLLAGVRAEAERDPRSRFLVNETFEELVDSDQRSVTVTSPRITYRFQGMVPAHPSILPLYLAFLDNFTQLQASDPRKLPPFPRIRLNQSIRRVGWIPTRVEISVDRNALFPESFAAHTEHELVVGLTPQHRRWILEAKQDWANLTPAGLAEYRGFDSRTRVANPINRSGNIR